MKTHGSRRAGNARLCVVIPVYNEEPGLHALFQRLSALIEQMNDCSVEVVLVDDHSTDQTPALLREACRGNPAFKYIRLSSNRGSHVAVLAGLKHVSGDVYTFLAADLQDPPELIPQLVAEWRNGSDVVWAVRRERVGLPLADRLFSATFYSLVRHFSNVDLGPKGCDYLLMDRRVVDALLQSVSTSPMLMADIAGLGFRQSRIPYTKEARQHGRSKWNLRRKLKLFADAFVAHSYFPLRIMSYTGLLSSAVGIGYALAIVVMQVLGNRPVQGWASLMVVVLVLGGIQMIMLGVIGEYLWRTLEEARRRPMYFIEESSDEDDAKVDGADRNAPKPQDVA